MRAQRSLRVSLLVVMVGVFTCSGCAMSLRLGSLPKPPLAGRNNTALMPMKRSEIVDGVDCSVYPLPLKDMRPVLPALTEKEVMDKKVLSQILINFIREEDRYITLHEARENALYSNWYMHCAPHLHFR